MTAPPSILKSPPLPARLKNLWSEVGAGRLTEEEFSSREKAWLGHYREVWSDALRLPGESDLTHSLCLELADLTGCRDMEEVKARCRNAVHTMKDEWHQTVRDHDKRAIEEYYDKRARCAFDLMWGHQSFRKAL
jgi:hypothetical protein